MDTRQEVKKGLTIWMTGLSGAGKSTISEKLKGILGEICFLLDGDVIRKGLNSDLKFSREDRRENIRRISEVAKLFNSAGMVVVVAFISPYEDDRNTARTSHVESGLKFLEVYIKASLEICEHRDVKGLYKKARKGEIPQFTGISDPYDVPSNPDVILETDNSSVEECVNILLNKISQAEDAKVTFTEDDSIIVYEEALNLLQIFQKEWITSDLKCFMNEEQLIECLHFKTFTEGKKSHFQAIPIILPINEVDKSKVDKLKSLNQPIKLISFITGRCVAQITNPDYYIFRKEEVCSRLLGTFSKEHPKIQKFYSEENYLLTGKEIKFFEEVKFEDGLDSYRLSVEEIQKLRLERNADCLYAFQVRNPLHNGHVMLLKEARKKLMDQGYKNPILLLHPCGGWTKDDDVPLNVRMDQYRVLLEDEALNKNETILAIWPSPMYYAGPVEVLWHFQSREMAGVEYMIVGRDPAGVKHPENKDQDLYDPTHGQRILDIASKKGLLKVQQIPFNPVLYNSSTQQMEFFKKANSTNYLNISGSELRRLAREGQNLPPGFMNEKGWHVLSEYYRSLDK